MFAKADKDRGGSITFDEFISFLQNESKQEVAQQKANLATAAGDPNAQYQARQKYDPLEVFFLVSFFSFFFLVSFPFTFYFVFLLFSLIMVC